MAMALSPYQHVILSILAILLKPALSVIPPQYIDQLAYHNSSYTTSHRNTTSHRLVVKTIPPPLTTPKSDPWAHEIPNMGKGVNITIPPNYSKHNLPSGAMTQVNIGKQSLMFKYLLISFLGIDIRDIPKVNDHDFSITLNGFFLVRWTDPRLVIENVKFGPEGDHLVPVDISMVIN